MTTAKDMIIDFINFSFGVIIIGLVILYFIAGDNFENFKRFMETLAPFIGLAILFLINLKMWRLRARKKEREGNLEITLQLAYFDKLKSDFFVFLLPISLLLISRFSNGRITLTDIVEALVIFILAFFWQKWLFGKER
jgi:putative flippase GtrA